ncbi:MAG TPA: TonB-dependent receptor [Bryobacteraceae bacterium]|nr:TonB-dependent receptor [Bryobacteraceae bacterium]
MLLLRVLLCAFTSALVWAQNKPPAETTLAPAERRTDLNLLAKTDAASGESRRNENVQFNLIDNNALKELNVRLGTTATLIDDAKADRNYFGAEFGNRPPAPIHLSPLKLANFHGSLFETHGNSVLNARSFFTVGSLPPAHENQYGAAVGFRIWKGASLSLDAGQQKLRGNVNGNIVVPKADERTPRTNDPAARALVQRFLDAFPASLPNRTDINERALNTNAPQNINDNNAAVRLDQKLTTRHSLFLRHQYTSQTVDAFQLVAGQNPDTTTRAHTAQLSWSYLRSPSTSILFTAMFDRVGSVLLPEPNAVGPQVNFSNVITTLGPGSNIPINRAQNRFRYGAALRQTRGRHNWYAGADYSRRQLNGAEASSTRGNLYFRNDFGRTVMENFLMGIPSRFSGSVGSIHRGFRSNEFAAFAGDDWRVNARLTLHYGLRYEVATVPTEVNNLNQLPYNTDVNNLAPRFGLALNTGFGTIRAAYSVHFGEIFPVTFSQIRYNPPLNIKFEIQAPDIAAPFGQLNIPADPNARSTFLAISPDLATPYTHLYSFSWEHAIGPGWKLQTGYVGSRSHKLLLLQYNNRAVPVPGIPQTTATINDRRPNPRYFDIRYAGNGSHGYFDAGRVSLVAPRWHNLTFETSYWFSKAIDTGAAYTNTATGDDGRQNQSQTESNIWADTKGPSSFDQKHALLARGSYATPGLRWLGSWDLSGVWLVKTGTPFSIVTGSDAPGFGNVDGDQGDRPNIVDPSILGRTIGNPDTARQLLPRSAFAYISAGEVRGNIGSNTFRKAGIANLNASVARTFSAGSDRKLLFRAEAVNLGNTPQFAEPFRELSSPNFAFITNTLNDGRAIRFHLRFQF